MAQGTQERMVPTLGFRRVLMTGAGGFVGKVLTSALAARLARDATIFCACRRPLPLPDRRGLSLNLDDQTSVDRAVETAMPDLVIHLAAQSSVAQSVDGAAATWEANLGGTGRLARSIATTVSDCTFLYASSAEVYGASFNDGRVDERTALRPQSAYARSKVAAEWLLDNVLPPSTRLIVARPVNHSGAGQSERFVIPAFAAQIARVELGLLDAVTVGSMDARRDFLHVDDVVQAYVDLLAGADAMPMRSVFNISSGRSTRIADILDGLLSLSGLQVDVIPDPTRIRPSDVPAAEISPALLNKATGWVPERSLTTILSDVLADQRRIVAGRFGTRPGQVRPLIDV